MTGDDDLSEYVKRYMRLEHAVTALKSKELVLPNPSKWDDTNDQEFLKLYRSYMEAKSIYALCCTMSAERYHHWRIFTEKKDANGVCIEFKRRPLQHALNRITDVRAEPVRYVPMKKMREKGAHKPDDLPFIKRVGYRDEREWRVVMTSDKPQGDFARVPFEPAWVHRIILNPWMNDWDRETARETLRSLIKRPARVTATFLTNSKPWKRLGKNLLGLTTGLLGGFTTFSAFSLDAVTLWQRGEMAALGAYVAGSVLLSIMALALGLWAVRSWA